MIATDHLTRRFGDFTAVDGLTLTIAEGEVKRAAIHLDKLPELAAFAPSPERQAEIDETLRLGRTKRLGLVRWNPEPRAEALARRRFEEANRKTIEKIIASELDGFQGAEVPGSRRENRIRKRIANLRLEGRGLETHGKQMLKACLVDHLRHYQIQNNRHVMARLATSAAHARRRPRAEALMA